MHIVIFVLKFSTSKFANNLLCAPSSANFSNFFRTEYCLYTNIKATKNEKITDIKKCIYVSNYSAMVFCSIKHTSKVYPTQTIRNCKSAM